MKNRLRSPSVNPCHPWSRKTPGATVAGWSECRLLDPVPFKTAIAAPMMSPVNASCFMGKCLTTDDTDDTDEENAPSLSVKSVSSVVKKPCGDGSANRRVSRWAWHGRCSSSARRHEKVHEALRSELVTEGHRRKQANRPLTTNRRVARCRRRFPLECAEPDLFFSGRSASSCQRQQIS